jgi:excisionase family DNA binding protein
VIFRKKALFSSIVTPLCAPFYIEMHATPYITGSTKAAPTELSPVRATPAVNVTIPLPTAAILAALADSPELLNEIAALVAARLEPTTNTRQLSDWLTTEEAADYLRCKTRRIYDLTSQGRLTAVKDGSRNLYERAELDRHLNLSDYARAARRRERYEQRTGTGVCSQSHSFGRSAGAAA